MTLLYTSCGRVLLAFLFLTGMAVSAVAWADDALKPRAEVGVKAGSERSNLTTEFWAPLAQHSDRVLYTDLRLMGDDDDNREGNLGLGYRQVVDQTNSVLGGHLWIDRRRTEHNSTFHQLTFGTESLGKVIDLRVNGYVPLNSGRVVTTPNTGSTTPYLVGNGLYYDTNGSINETPQYGIDAEVGYRLPVLQKYTDTIRIYGGGYHFFRSNTENVTGFRFRTEVVINPVFSVGARFQHDDPRGSQGFLEATLRFPFSAKKLYQKDGLRSRLDESPERDIDIVTASKVDTGLRKSIINTTTGVQQRILYVDNTNTNTGDGTKENPFNSLASAQTALQTNDILYIAHGDGTTRNMDQGVVLNKAGVQLIGSGSALSINGYTFLQAGDAPVITNTQLNTTDYFGNGILVTADKISVSGITVTNAKSRGVSVNIVSGQVLENVSISNMTLNNNDWAIGVINSGIISQVDIRNVVTNNNNLYGVVISNTGGGRIETTMIDNVVTNSSGYQNIRVQSVDPGSVLNNVFVTNSSMTGNGAFVLAQNAGTINNASFSHTSAINSTANGYRFITNNLGSSINNINVDNNQAIGNLTFGINFTSQDSGVIGTVTANNNITNNNTQSGINFSNLTAGQINTVNLQNNIANNNAQNGIIFDNTTNGVFNDVTVQNNVTNNNIQNGIYMRNQTDATTGHATFDKNTSANNTRNGLYFTAANAANMIVSVSQNTLTGNGTASAGTKYYGLNIDNDSTGAFNVDVGGGTLGSIGQNRIFNSFYQDVFIDSMPGTGTTTGAVISAKNNWWGVNTGLAAGRRTLDTNSQIDASAFLTTDPHP
jgi:hypothetical protein